MDLDELYRLLRGAHVRAQGVLDTIRDPLLVLDSDLTVMSANPAFYHTFETSREDTVGRSFSDMGGGHWNHEELNKLMTEVIPKSTSVIDYEIKANFPQVGARTLLVSVQRLRVPDNGQRILMVTIVDATVRRQSENDKNILIGELDHRLKNMLSMTLALARQTSVTNRTAAEYRDAFIGRFEALARSLTVSTSQKAAKLGSLASAVMEPFLDGRARIALADEPEVELSARQAMSVGMIIHELATNAAKYGALSVPEGQVEIDWAVLPLAEEGPQLRLDWKERQGPRVVPPSEIGFGTKLIRYTAEQLGGQVELSYQPHGLSAEVTFPLQ